jgi:hypothetical protein
MNNFMIKITTMFFFIITISCHNETIKLKINKVDSDKIEYTIENNSKKDISILVPANDFFCYERENNTDYERESNTNYEYKLIYNLYDLEHNMLDLNLNLSLTESIEQKNQQEKQLENKEFILKRKNKFKDYKHIPTSKNDCFYYHILKKNETYYIQVSLIGTKDAPIRSNLYKFTF